LQLEIYLKKEIPAKMASMCVQPYKHIRAIYIFSKQATGNIEQHYYQDAIHTGKEWANTGNPVYC
jgi:hypothetical protein